MCSSDLLEAAAADGLIERLVRPEGRWWRPTERGFDFLSDLQERFL